MKKSLFLIGCFFSLLVVCSAEEKWQFDKTELSERINIIELKEKADGKGFYAIGDYYGSAEKASVNGSGWLSVKREDGKEIDPSSFSMLIAQHNLYSIGKDGKVTKENKFAFTLKDTNVITLSLDENKKLERIKTEYNSEKFGYDVLIKSINDDLEILKFHSPDVFYEEDNNWVYIYEIEFKDKDGNIKSSIIDGYGNFLIEPSTDYSILGNTDYYIQKDEGQDEWLQALGHDLGMAVLKFNDSYLVYSGNKKQDVLTDKFFALKEGMDISNIDFEAYNDSLNYYSFVSDEKAQNACNVSYKKYYMTSKELLSNNFSSQSSIFWVANKFIIDEPCSTSIKIGNDSIYDLKGNVLSPDTFWNFSDNEGILSYKNNDKVLFYNDSREILSIDYDFLESGNFILLQDSNTKESLYYFSTFIFTEISHEYIYTLSKEIIEEKPDITPDPDSKKDYSCKKIDGVYYDKNGKAVTKEQHEKDCLENPDTGYVIPVIGCLLAVGGYVLIKKKPLKHI